MANTYMGTGDWRGKLREGIFVVVFLACSSGAGGFDLVSLKNGQVVLDSQATESEIYAAEEFQRLFHEASGARLPIVETPEPGGIPVFIGPGRALTESSLHGGMDREFGYDELRIVIAERGVAITGARPRGVLYGVYTFLEDYLGVRFLTETMTHVPKLPPTKIVKKEDRTYKPPLEYRYYLKPEVINDPAFMARRRQNGRDRPIPAKMGGTAPRQVFLHNNFGFHDGGGMEIHPEYQTLSMGKRRSMHPCLSHPDVQRMVWKRIEENLPTRGSGTLIPLAQNDANHPCDCPRCLVVRREGDTPETLAERYSPEIIRTRFGRDVPLGMGHWDYGHRSGPSSVSIISFVNHLAEKLVKVRPDIRIGTMAYSMSMMPPHKTRVHENVVVQFATYHACVLHGYNDPDCRINRNTGKYMEGWNEVCDHLVMWYYDHNHHDMLSVVPNLRLQAASIQFFVANSAKGIFTQGTARNNGFSDLRAYWITALHWNPDQDSEALIREFLDLYYGPEPAVLIRQWLDLVHDGVDSDRHTNIGYQPWHLGLDPELGETGIRLFEQAMAKAENDEIRERIEKVSITAWRLSCEPLIWNATWGPVTAEARKVPLETVTFPLTEDEKETQHGIYQRLIELCEKHGVREYAEGQLIEKLTTRVMGYLGVAEDAK